MRLECELGFYVGAKFISRKQHCMVREINFAPT